MKSIASVIRFCCVCAGGTCIPCALATALPEEEELCWDLTGIPYPTRPQDKDCIRGLPAEPVAHYQCPGAGYPTLGDEIFYDVWSNINVSGIDKWWKVFQNKYIGGSAREYLAGWYNPASPYSVYRKWSNAAALSDFGVDSRVMPTGQEGWMQDLGYDFPRPRHGRRDYRRLARSCQTTSHYEYFPWARIWEEPPTYGELGLHSAEDWGGLVASTGFYDGDEAVFLRCSLFDPIGLDPESGDPTDVNPNAHPVVRAGVLIHEGQHSWEFRYQDDSDYGHKLCGKIDCDTNHEHSRYDIAEGELYNHTHNPYQVEREFYCDLAERPRGWVPDDFRAMAYIWAIARDAFLDPKPADHCGNPFPLGRTPEPGAHCSSTACQCGAGLTFCPSYGCVDLEFDPEHCGGCRSTCDGWCSGGLCQADTCDDTPPCHTGEDCPATGVCLEGCCAKPLE